MLTREAEGLCVLTRRPTGAVLTSEGEAGACLQADRVAAFPFGPVECRVGGVGQFLAGGSVLGVACDAYRDGSPGGGAVPLERVRLDAATDLLGQLHGRLLGAVGEDGLVLVAAEAGGVSAFSLV